MAMVWWTLLAAGLTDDAYRAYKKGHYSLAFDLYNKAYEKEGSIKAAYNLGVFYEKGIGVRQNREKAKEYYRRVKDHVAWDAYSEAICRDPMLPYYRKALRKLIRLGERKEARIVLEQMEERCGDKAARKGGVCTGDGKIASRYRDLAGCIDCAMVRKYPDRVRKFLKLAQERDRYKKRYEKSGDMKVRSAYLKTNRRIRKLMLPIVREWSLKEIECIRHARTGRELEGCGMRTFHCATRLAGCDLSIAECPPDADDPDCIALQKRRAKQLTDRDREEAIRNVRESMETDDYYFGECPI
jgi:tetratricopeptide (TPR) repeat protein